MALATHEPRHVSSYVTSYVILGGRIPRLSSASASASAGLSSSGARTGIEPRESESEIEIETASALANATHNRPLSLPFSAVVGPAQSKTIH